MPYMVTAIRVEDVQRRLQTDEIIWRRAIPEGLMTLTAEMVPAIVEMHTPRRSGNLAKSAQVKVWPNRLHIWFDAPYAVYVDEGTGPSSGRYVPEPLGKRLINTSKRNPDIGTHPGIKAAHFSEAIANDLKDDLISILNVIVAREWIR